jgi:DNA-binding PadR family transcriptional regulator
MTISAPRRDENGKGHELAERTRRAWTAYRESLRDLTGRDYDEAEGRSWDRLQRKLKELEEERAALTSRGGSPPVKR